MFRTEFKLGENRCSKKKNVNSISKTRWTFSVRNAIKYWKIFQYSWAKCFLFSHRDYQKFMSFAFALSAIPLRLYSWAWKSNFLFEGFGVVWKVADGRLCSLFTIVSHCLCFQAETRIFKSFQFASQFSPSLQNFFELTGSCRKLNFCRSA